MRYKIIAVRDRAADVFGVPQFVVNIGTAVRSFGDGVRVPSTSERPNPFYDHPDDFDLYMLGEFDDEVGEFITQRPQQIAVGKDYVEK